MVARAANNAKKIDWIDSLKGIATCGIVMVHGGVDVLPFPLGRLGGGSLRKACCLFSTFLLGVKL